MLGTAQEGYGPAFITPGLVCKREPSGGRDRYDVLRGEETLVVGALLKSVMSGGPGGGGGRFLRTRIFVLVNAQATKWVLVHDGQIVWFASFMTAEIYQLVAQLSSLAPLFAPTGPSPMGQPAADWTDLDVEAGLAEVAAEPQASLLHRLTAVKTEVRPAVAPPHILCSHAPLSAGVARLDTGRAAAGRFPRGHADRDRGSRRPPAGPGPAARQPGR